MFAIHKTKFKFTLSKYYNQKSRSASAFETQTSQVKRVKFVWRLDRILAAACRRLAAELCVSGCLDHDTYALIDAKHR